MEADDIDAREQKAWGQALANLRELANLTQEDAAKAFGLGTRAGWAKYERGIAKSILTPGTQRALAEALGYGAEDLMRERSRIDLDGARPLTAEVVPFRRAEPSQTLVHVPTGMCAVYGLAAAQGEYIAVAAGTEIRWVPMHPAQRGYSKIGAAEVVGESMYPRYKPRELAYFVFNLPPSRGDDAIIELLDGTAMIKEYLGRTKSHLLLREYFPEHRSFDVPLEDVHAIHAVVG